MSLTAVQANMSLQLETSSAEQQQQQQHSKIWWSNGTAFVATHVAAAIGCYHYPIYDVPRNTLILCVVLSQLAELSSVTTHSCEALLAHHIPA